MKAGELRELTIDELKQRELDLSEELFNLKFQLATSQLENKMRVPQVKKDLARIKTIIREKQK
ncbi:MAG: 50S ribosomal protein L29 [Deltaproteobacteria bacterium DG_8]|nr:MAG: 50S ribosomal protein L29 [Deltaproteobacteria bacterium DG_8]